MPATDTAPPLSPAMEQLRKAGQALAKINARRERAVADLRDAIRAADHEGGHTRSELVAVAGVARQTVYDALKPDPSSTPAPEPTAAAQ